MKETTETARTIETETAETETARNRAERETETMKETTETARTIEILTARETARTIKTVYNGAILTTEGDRTKLAGLLMACPRNDGPPLIDRILQAARNDRYRFELDPMAADDTEGDMLESLTQCLIDTPEIAAESYAYIVNRVRWHARDERRKTRSQTARNAYSLDTQITGSDQDAHETNGSDLATDAIDNHILDMDLRLALSQIDRAQADAFLLRHAYGFDYETIAAKLETTQDNARQMVRRARTALAERLPNRKPAPDGCKTLTIAKFASLDPRTWNRAQDVKTGRIVKAAETTDHRLKRLMTFGNGETMIVDRRRPIAVTMAPADDLTTTETHDRKTRTTDPNAPAPAHLTRPPRWHETQYQTRYTFGDLDQTGRPMARRVRMPARPHFITKDGAHTCYNWEHYQITDGPAPAIVETDPPTDPAQWLKDYNESLTR